jgi:peptidyl-prolyl cis-trans isomerase D
MRGCYRRKSMLKFLRKKKNIKLGLWALVIVVIVTFVFGWGGGQYAGRGRKEYPRHAGVIFGRRISTEDFLQSRREVYRQLLMLYGQNLRQVLDHLDLDRQTWDRLILLEEARRRNIKVSNEEVVEQIKNMPIFQEDDKFDSRKYSYIVTYFFKIDRRTFEEGIRNDIRIKKVFETVINNIVLTEEELLEIYKKEHEKIKVSFLLIEPESFTEEIEAAEVDLKEYYQENKQRFRVPHQVNIEYLPVTIALTKDEVEVDDKETKIYYEQNKEFFRIEVQEEPEKAEYQPYKEVKDDIKKMLVNKRSKDKAFDLAVGIYKRIEGGATFGQIEDEYGLKAKTSGLFSGDQSIPEIGWSYDFVNTAFALNKNEISEIVELPDGYYILKLKDEKASHVPEYEKIEDRVRKAYINEEALSLARKKAVQYQETIKQKINEGEVFQDALDELGLKITVTDFFTREDYIRGLGQATEFKETIFKEEPGAITEVVKVSRGYAFARIEDYQRIDAEKFKEEKEDFKIKALANKEIEVFNAWFNNLKKEAGLRSFI